jgi:CelD/BcsL family acetyltransferase involved in cellulose biosynthesis
MNAIFRAFGWPQGAPLLEEHRADTADAGLRAQVLTDWASVRMLAPEWNALLGKSRADTIYLSWEWVSAWAEVVGRRHRPMVITARDRAGALCALAPLYTTRYTLLGAVPYTVLRVMGDQPTGAEYPDWVLRRDCEREAAEAIAKTLAESRRRWDLLWMPQVSGWSGARERIVAGCRAAGLHCNSRPSGFGSIALPGSIDDYEKALSDNRRRQFRSQRNKIMRKPGVTISRCRSADELPRYLAALFDLHGRRREALGERGTFLERPDETHFYKAFVPLALEKGWLRLSALRDEGEFKAVQLGYVYGNAYHQLQEGFDPAYLAGAGNVLRYEVIRECIESGIREYDFLGGYTDHKRRWLASPRGGYDLLIGRPGALNLAVFEGAVWPTGRFLKPAAA